MTQLVTIEDLKQALPSKKSVITQEAVDIINASMEDPEFQEETLLYAASMYESIMKKTKTPLPKYLNAIKFCAYINTSSPNYTEAYKKVFADREFVKKRMSVSKTDKLYSDLTSAASRYRKTKLVTDILTATQVPLDLMFTGHRFKAISILAEVMEDAKLDRDKINAAKELLAATKGPDNVKVELDVGYKESSAVQQLNDQLVEIAGRSIKHLEAGSTSLHELGGMKVISDDMIEGELVGKDM
jgi:hypothetical protein